MPANFLPIPIRTSQQFRFTMTVAATILFVTCGCNPSEKTTSPSSTSAAESPASLVADPVSTESEVPEHDDGSVVLSGDLDAVDWDSMIGQRVTIQGELVVVDTYDLARRGQVKVARKRLYVPTSQVDPNDADPSATSSTGGSNVAQVTAAQKFNDNAIITLDDDSQKQNVFPPKLFPGLGKSQPTVRAGSVINGFHGLISKAGNDLVLVSNEPLQWTPAKRPQKPSVGDAGVTVASFNVLNYFTTIDDGKNNARGADNESELTRQEAKIVAAISALDADVFGLMELENNLKAEQRLLAALNEKVGKNVFKGCGLPSGFRRAPGARDSIRVGIIYRADRVSPLGDVSLIDDKAFFVARTPIVQTFKAKSGGEPFTVIVNHFKSKGGASDAGDANKNKGDGQGAYNAARRGQALAIQTYINELKGSVDPRVLVIGDLNAYQQEDPIDALRASGLVDLHERFGRRTDSDGEHYSYVYFGQCGSLDHAFATESLAADVTGVATWHINADEPRSLDYNEEYNPKSLYQPDPFRSSDHDPVLIGIRN